MSHCFRTRLASAFAVLSLAPACGWDDLSVYAEVDSEPLETDVGPRGEVSKEHDAALDCTHLDEPCRLGAWDESANYCRSVSKSDGTACDDENACTLTDACLAGVCTGSDPLPCTSEYPCNQPGACDPATGTCTSVPLEDGAECDDGDPCTDSEECIAGACVGQPLACDDQVACTADSCDPQGGGCVHDATGCECSTDEQCDDSNPCNGTETCDATSGTCVVGAAVSCEMLDDACNVGVCLAASGECVKEPRADGLACDDDDPCTVFDGCAMGVCEGEPTNCDDGVACTADSCDVTTGVCIHDTAGCECTDDAHCDDGNPCNGVESCATDEGHCAPGAAVQCEHLDDDCNLGFCDSATGGCVQTPREDGWGCDDGNACTQSDTCVDGICMGAEPKPCPAVSQCHGTGTCDPSDGQCSAPKLADGVPCDDDDPCTTSDQCQAGACVGGAPPIDSTGDWTIGMGGSGDDTIRGLALDPNGNIFAIGDYSSATMTMGVFGSGNNAMLTKLASQAAAGFVLQYSLTGHVVSARRVAGSATSLSLYGIDLLPDGSRAIVGTADGATTLGSGSSSSSIGDGTSVMFASRLSIADALIWAGTGQGALPLTVSASPTSVYWSGINAAGSDSVFDVGDGTTSSLPVGSSGFVASTNSVGGLLAWTAPIQTSGFGALLTDTAVLPDGGLVVAGNFCKTSVFGTGLAAVSLSPTGQCDGLAARYAGDGTLVWVRSIGGPTDAFATSVAVLGGDAIAVGGMVTGAARVAAPEGQLAVLPDGVSDDADAIVVAFDLDGNVLWSDRGVGTGPSWLYDLASRGGRVSAVGSVSGVADFGSGSAKGLVTEPDSSGEPSLFALQYTDSGQLLWAAKVSGPGEVSVAVTESPRVATHEGGAVTMSGNFRKTTTLGSTTKNSFAPKGGSDMFLLHVNSADGLQCQ